MAILLKSVSIIYITCLVLLNANGHSLLKNGDTYIDTESKSALTKMCKKDPSSLSSWEVHQCQSIKTRDEYQKCWPQRRMSHCAPGKLRGVMIFYHGFSACPDAYNTIAASLQSKCWHVYQPTTIGHGYKYCGIAYDGSKTEQSCTAGKYNQSTLPVKRQPYIDFVNTMNDIISDELSIIKKAETTANAHFNANDLEIAVGGLSFGAPLAAAAVVLDANPSMYTKVVLLSPFFGLGYKGLDDLLYKCLAKSTSWTNCLSPFLHKIGYNMTNKQVDALTDVIGEIVSYYVDEQNLDTSFATFNLLVRKLLSWSVEAPEFITNKKSLQKVETVLNKVVGWGSKCELDEASSEAGGLDRGGFCRFSLRKGIAAHSFSQYITQEYVRKHSVDQSVETLAVMVERDGKTRASLVNKYIHLFYESDADKIYNKTLDCMWLISRQCEMEHRDIDNICGVPHASIAKKDNLLIPPYKLYWEEDYNGGVIDWLNNKEIENHNFAVKTGWDGTRNQCVYVDLNDPSEALVADTPSLIHITFSGVAKAFLHRIKKDFLDRLATLTGATRGLLELSHECKHDEAKNKSTMSMFLNGNSANSLKRMLDLEGVEYVGDNITNITVGCDQYELASTEWEDAVTAGNKSEDNHVRKEQNEGLMMIGYVVMGIMIGCVLMVSVGCILIQCKGYRVTSKDGKQYALMKELL